MAITLSQRFLDELRKGVNTPTSVLEVELDGGTVKWGKHALPGVSPIIKSVSSLQNKLDTKTGFSTRGQLTVVILGRDNFKTLIQNNYLKNRRVTRKDGFIADLFGYSDFAATFTGRISDWSRKGDELTITISDDLIDASKKLPVENDTKTQNINLQNMNPVDMMTTLMLTHLGIGAGLVDSAAFEAKRDLWLNGWKFDRVLTEPKEANEYLNALQIESNSFIIHDGEKITFSVFAPPIPSETVEELTEKQILGDSFSVKSGYKDNFFNRVVVYYDYTESGGDKEEDYEAAVIAADAASQDPSQWDEVKTKVIKSKFIRSHTYGQPSQCTGVVIYHVSRANGTTGDGSLTYNDANNTLQWKAPGGASYGEAVTLSKDGKYQLFDTDKTKYIRVSVTTASLPTADKTDVVTMVPLSGETYATALAVKLLNRFRNPAVSVSFDLDINNIAYNGQLVKPSDIKELTTDEASEYGDDGWNKESVLLTSVRPDYANHKIAVEAIETKMYKKYAFIAPAGYPDYGSATADQKKRAFIRTADPQYSIW